LLISEEVTLLEVVYGEKKWNFDRDLSYGELIKETRLGRVSVLVMVNGRLVRNGEMIPAKSRVLIISAANGG
jgi:sulfur carrier protein ThiS